MSRDDGFLGRWSRRKRSAVTPRHASAKPLPPPVATDITAPNAPAVPVSLGVSDVIAEPPSLPPIESLDSASDIAPFLAPGVPAELTRQALRRAWQTDPAIRDFVGLSENAWDFNAPNGVPGFGPLTAEDIRRLMDGVTGEPEEARSGAAPASRSGPENQVSPQAPPGEDTAAGKDQPSSTPPVQEDSAVQHGAEATERRPSLPRRRHGGALPG
jgi:hypothetical protein